VTSSRMVRCPKLVASQRGDAAQQTTPALSCTLSAQRKQSGAAGAAPAQLSLQLMSSLPPRILADNNLMWFKTSRTGDVMIEQVTASTCKERRVVQLTN
jgi:hypothetical protein